MIGCAKLFQKWADDFQKHPNQLPLFDAAVAGAAGGDPNIVYYHSYWQLAPDEALVIDATPPECDYWNFQLSNHWLESLDYRYWPIHLNKATAKYRARRLGAHRGGARGSGRAELAADRRPRPRLDVLALDPRDAAPAAARARGEARRAPARGRGVSEPVELSVESLLAEARAQAGLDDFGDERFREGLGVLLETYDSHGEPLARRQEANAAAPGAAPRHAPARRGGLEAPSRGERASRSGAPST